MTEPCSKPESMQSNFDQLSLVAYVNGKRK